MNIKNLVKEIKLKKSCLCVGLDTDLQKIPKHLLETEDPVFEFNKAIIDHTKDYCVAYKPNIAFYESLGPKGWESLSKTLDYIPDTHYTIADAKRGDIGNTSKMYAKTFFEYYNFDSVTVAPYMGRDSVEPFVGYKDKAVIILALTSNKGASDFQFHKDNEELLFEKVLNTSKQWANEEELMYVVGATKAQELKKIRSIVPNHFLLIPGVGAQGGSLDEVMKNGMNDDIGLLINSSRGIIYASDQKDFGEVAGRKAKEMADQMKSYI